MKEDEPNQLSQLKRQNILELKVIRKNKREEIYKYNREIFASAHLSEGGKQQSDHLRMKIVDDRYETEIKEIMEEPIQNITLEDIIQGLGCNDVYNWHFGLINLRKMVQQKDSPQFIQSIFDHELIGGLVEYMGRDEYPQLKLEAARIITALTYGNKTQGQRLLYHKAHLKMCDFIKREQPIYTQLAIMGLGNLAVNGFTTSSQLVESGAIEFLTEFGYLTKNPKEKANVIWALSNIILASPSAEMTSVDLGLKFLCRAFIDNYYYDRSEFSNYILSALMIFSSHKTMLIYYEQGILPKLLTFCDQKSQDPLFTNSLVKAIILLGKFSFFSVFVTKMIRQTQLLFICEKLLLRVAEVNVVKNIIFLLSNIAGDNSQNANQLLQSKSLLKIISKIFEEGAFELRYQCAFLFKNACSIANQDLITEIIDDRKIILAVTNTLKAATDPEEFADVADCLLAILRLGRFNSLVESTYKNQFAQEFLSIPDIIDWLDEKSADNNQKIRKTIEFLWESINQLDSDEDENKELI